MAEIKKFFIVSDPQKIDGSYAWLWEDPAVKDEETRIAQVAGALSEGGYDVDTFVRIYMGTWHRGKNLWTKEHSKVYDDAASARTDAEKRLAKAKKIYEREKGGAAMPDKQAAHKLVTRFRNGG